MCGIVGVLLRRGLADEEPVQRMARALAHRGPDDLGIFVRGPCALAHRRLSIIDLEGGHQPIVNEPLALCVVGEIYNFVELRASLEARGRRFASRSDSETILHSYALDGITSLASFNGMFAFALYDSQSGRLVLGRDRIGIKPLYYARLPDRLLFASELKGLLAVWPSEPDIDPAALVQYLQNRFTTRDAVIVRGIQRVPPGTALVIDRDLNVRVHRYWSPLAVCPREIPFERAVEEFDPMFRQVMREHLRADVPYGLFLSSGVDSAVLLASITKLSGRPLRSFTVGYEGAGDRQELSGAAAIARRFGAEHTEVIVNNETILRGIPRCIWATDDLLHDYACFPTSFLAESAARELKVVFTGEGGDEVFAGYGRYRRSALQKWLGSLVAPGSGGFRTRGYWRRGWVHDVFGPELMAANSARRRPFVEAWTETPRSWRDVMRRQYADMVTYLPDDLLVKTDRILMAFALEGRVPFLDHRVIEFGLALPDRLKVFGREGKVFLKRWAEAYIPRDHLWTRKRGFYVPISPGLHGSLLERLAERLPQHPAIRRWFRPQGVAQLIREQHEGGNTARAIWGLMQFALWHRIFIDGNVPSRNEDPLEWLE